jgi:hypothetical protein
MPRSCVSVAAEAPEGGIEPAGAGTLGAGALGDATLGAGMPVVPALGAGGDGLLTGGGVVTGEGFVAGEALGVALLTAPCASRLQRSTSACVGDVICA